MKREDSTDAGGEHRARLPLSVSNELEIEIADDTNSEATALGREAAAIQLDESGHEHVARATGAAFRFGQPIGLCTAASVAFPALAAELIAFVAKDGLSADDRIFPRLIE